MLAADDHWHCALHLDDPAAVRRLLQAALTAHRAIDSALHSKSRQDFAMLDWRSLHSELQAGLAAVGHPAGG